MKANKLGKKIQSLSSENKGKRVITSVTYVAQVCYPHRLHVTRIVDIICMLT